MKNRELRLNDARFHNFPKRISKKDYEVVIEDISKGFGSIAHSLYMWGSISEPGISDLDILVVLKDSIKSIPLKHKSIYFMDKNTRYIVVHPFIISNTHIAEKMPYIYPDGKFTKVYGEDLNFITPNANELKNLRISLLNDIIIRHLPRDFLHILNSGKVNVRDLLLRLKSLTYSIKLYNLATGKEIKNSEKYKNSILDLRKNWFSLSQEEQEKRIVDLFNLGLNISLGIVYGFNGYLEKKKLADIDKKINAVSYSGEKNKTNFTRNWKKSAISKQNGYVSLPLSLCAQLYCYGDENGVLSKFIDENLNPKKIKFNLKYKKSPEKRIKILNEQASLAEKYGHLHFPAFFDFGYRPEKGLLNRLAKIAYKSRKLIS